MARDGDINLRRKKARYVLSSFTNRAATLRVVGGTLRFGWFGEVLVLIPVAVGRPDGRLEIAFDVGRLGYGGEGEGE